MHTPKFYLPVIVSLILLVSVFIPGTAMAGAGFKVIKDKQYVLRATGPLRSDIYVPEGTGPFPAVVVIHGGGWEGGERSDMNRFARELAENGFVAMNISYRLAPDAIHPAQIEDCREAVSWLRRHADDYKVDPAQVGAFGYSAGAHLAMMLAVMPVAEGDQSTGIQAAVAGAGPTDLRQYPNSPLVQAYIGGPPGGREQLYADASPVVHVTADDSPVYIYHGKRDSLVGVEQAEAMAAALGSAGVDFELDIQPFGHVLTYFLDGDVMERAIDFLKQKLSS